MERVVVEDGCRREGLVKVALEEAATLLGQSSVS